MDNSFDKIDRSCLEEVLIVLPKGTELMTINAIFSHNIILCFQAYFHTHVFSDLLYVLMNFVHFVVLY